MSDKIHTSWTKWTSLLLYSADVDKLLDFCMGRDCAPADVIELLIDEHLDELKDYWVRNSEKYEADYKAFLKTDP